MTGAFRPEALAPHHDRQAFACGVEALDHYFAARVTLDMRLGSAMLWDAVLRARRAEVAVFALVVDAKDARAEAFYRYQGFAPFGLVPRQLFLPL